MTVRLNVYTFYLAGLGIEHSWAAESAAEGRRELLEALDEQDRERVTSIVMVDVMPVEEAAPSWPATA